MRLWHKDLIPVLPRQQLISQWRECCCIARNISVKGTPNHLLVNKILNYPIEHFHYYTSLVACEMEQRGFKCDYSKFTKWIHIEENHCTYEELFKDWHNHRYYNQCYCNLEEKFDCGGIDSKEWLLIVGQHLGIDEKIIRKDHDSHE